MYGAMASDLPILIPSLGYLRTLRLRLYAIASQGIRSVLRIIAKTAPFSASHMYLHASGLVGSVPIPLSWPKKSIFQNNYEKCFLGTQITLGIKAPILSPMRPKCHKPFFGCRYGVPVSTFSPAGCGSGRHAQGQKHIELSSAFGSSSSRLGFTTGVFWLGS